MVCFHINYLILIGKFKPWVRYPFESKHPNTPDELYRTAYFGGKK